MLVRLKVASAALVVTGYFLTSICQLDTLLAEARGLRNSMQARLNVVTLGVRDIAKARAFYEALGFVPSEQSNQDVVFLNAGGVVLALFGRAALAEDAHLPEAGTGFGGIALAQNVAARGEVDARIQQAVSAGATLLKPAAETFWGGYAGYFADPDGHPWEVAHNPFWPLSDDGLVTLP